MIKLNLFQKIINQVLNEYSKILNWHIRVLKQNSKY